MSGYAMEWALATAKSKGLDPTARLVFLALAEHANARKGWSYAGAEMIAADTGYSERRVRDAMARIRAADLVECRVRPGYAAEWRFPPAPPRGERPPRSEPPPPPPRTERPDPLRDPPRTERPPPPRTERPDPPDVASADPGHSVRGTRGNKVQQVARPRPSATIRLPEPPPGQHPEPRQEPRQIDAHATMERIRGQMTTRRTLGPTEVIAWRQEIPPPT